MDPEAQIELAIDLENVAANGGLAGPASFDTASSDLVPPDAMLIIAGLLPRTSITSAWVTSSVAASGTRSNSLTATLTPFLDSTKTMQLIVDLGTIIQQVTHDDPLANPLKDVDTLRSWNGSHTLGQLLN
jgi:hypothetical protein